MEATPHPFPKLRVDWVVQNMDADTLARRRKRRRVADDKRKRAARACNGCKARKSKCMPGTPEKCRRCLEKDLTCDYDRETTPENEQHGYQDPPSMDKQVVASPRHIGDENISINSHQADRIAWPNFLSRLRQAFSLDVQSAPEAHDMMAMQAHIASTLPLQPAQLPRLRRAIDALPPRPVADFLISVCIKHGVDCFFYFDQCHFLEEIDEFYKNPHSPLRLDCGFVALALATFALGSQWTPLEKPEGWSSSSTTPKSENTDPGMIFHNQLRDLVPDLIEQSSLRSIQVIFLIGVYLMPLSPVGSSYIYMGLALRKALAFDLHQNTDDAVLDEKEVEIRRRLWWSIYSLERITTIKLNRSQTVSGNVITVPLPSTYPSIDGGQFFDNIQHQIAFAKLVRILDSITNMADDITDKTQANSRSRVKADLKSWKRSLPSDFRLSKIHPKSSGYRAVFHLHLNYYYAHISMGKTAVVTVVRSHLRQHLASDPGSLQIDSVIKDLAFSCINAAEKILRLFEDLMNTGNIVRLSFTDFQGCSIATIVTLLAGILDRDSGYEARITFGLGCLRKMAAGNMTAKLGVRFVEALQAIANEAVAKLRQTETTREAISQDDQETGFLAAADYVTWAQWLSRHESRPSSSSNTPSETLAHANIDRQSLEERENTVNKSASWEHGGNSHVHHSSSIPDRTAFQQPGIFSDYMDPTDAQMPSLFLGEDQSFLMGLTGLDVLDFTELMPPL